MFFGKKRVGENKFFGVKHFWAQKRFCRQVNYLEPLTACPSEEEWLFQHYSAFTVLTVPDLFQEFSVTSPARVELQVAADNRNEVDTLPLSEWH